MEQKSFEGLSVPQGHSVSNVGFEPNPFSRVEVKGGD